MRALIRYVINVLAKGWARVETQEQLDQGQHEQVRNELARLLLSKHFRRTERCGEFLRYIVEARLQGDYESLKERSIGIDLFGRVPDFNTAEDSVVRVTANMVRRRLAQVYDSAPETPAIRIEVPVGSYTPQFVWAPDNETASVSPSTRTSRPPVAVWVAGTGVTRAVAAALGIALLPSTDVRGRAVDEFWRPFLSQSHVPLLCLGSPVTYRLSQRLYGLNGLPPSGEAQVDAAISLLGIDLRPDDIQSQVDQYTGLASAGAAALISGFLGRHGVSIEVRGSNATAFADLKNRSVIVMGALTNRWTIHFNPSLRFQVVRDQGGSALRDISDEKIYHASHDRDGAANEGYAAVSRLYDPQSGGNFLIISGTSQYGNQGATDFLLDRAQLGARLVALPSGWPTKNLEFLLRMRVVAGTPARAEVVASRIW